MMERLSKSLVKTVKNRNMPREWRDRHAEDFQQPDWEAITRLAEFDDTETRVFKDVFVEGFSLTQILKRLEGDAARKALLAAHKRVTRKIPKLREKLFQAEISTAK